MYIITAGCLCSPLFSVSLVYFTFIMPVDLHDFTNSLASAQSRDLVFTVLLPNETASSKPETLTPTLTITLKQPITLTTTLTRALNNRIRILLACHVTKNVFCSWICCYVNIKAAFLFSFFLAGALAFEAKSGGKIVRGIFEK